jgi:hypothetical protein
VLTESTLMLRFVSEQPGWFTDRPYREAGQIPTEEFVRLWNEGENSFADDPPNAAFTCEVGDEVVNYVVALSKPEFDRKTIDIVDVDSITQFERVDLTYDVSIVPSSGGGTSGACVGRRIPLCNGQRSDHSEDAAFWRSEDA